MKPFDLEWWLDRHHEAVYYSKNKYFDEKEMEKDFELIAFIEDRIIKKYGESE